MLRTRPVPEGRANERIGGTMCEFLEFLALESETGNFKKKKGRKKKEANNESMR